MTKEIPSNKTTRRAILKGASALALPTFLPSSVFGANEKKINIAWVGFGNMGWGDLNNCAGGNNVVALCDCNPGTWVRAKKKFPGAKFYKDFRKMLEEMGDQIDVVGVGTPDHCHFSIAYTAMSMGKHVFVEKPLVHSLWEARTLQALAREKGVVTQMGNQGHAFEGAYLVKEWYEAGLIGEVKEVLTWTDRPARGWGFNGKVRSAYPAAEKLPEGMDWNIWLGPCQEDVPFSRALHPTTWRPWWSFGCGGLGDIGCHTIEGTGGFIQKYYKNKALAPPNLNGEGEKVQANWLFSFLKAPIPVRPWLKVRMPSFAFSDQETNLLVSYFNGLSKVRIPYVYFDHQKVPRNNITAGQRMISKDYFDCLSCHQQGEKKPEGPTDGWAPDLTLAHSRLNPNWIIKWLQDPQKVQPGTKMPSFYPGGPDDILGGKDDRQIEALRDYIMTLGKSGAIGE